jgi:hypothetical protein
MIQLYRDPAVYAGSLEPLPALPTEPFKQSEFPVIDAGEDPGGGIAEAFARIFAPAARAALEIGGGELLLPPLCGPAQFPVSPGVDLAREQVFISAAQRVSQPQPDEVEKLMDEDTSELCGIARERGFEHDAPLAQKGSGMDRPAMAKITDKTNMHRRTPGRRQTLHQAESTGLKTTMRRLFEMQQQENMISR